jgi:FkbM family methyltransferase
LRLESGNQEEVLGDNTEMQKEVLPPLFWPNFFRRLRFLAGTPGWRRLVSSFVPQNRVGHFRIRNGDLFFEGELSSFVDREVFLYGGYEAGHIRAFLSSISKERRGIIIDVGANIGTHSQTFSRYFEKVYSFEPNPVLWKGFLRNLEINDIHNVTLHKAGLAAEDKTMPFYAINKNNMGLGTFSPIEQYDLPLRQIGEAQVVSGDGFVERNAIGPIDAIKIDVQGYEGEVLRGLQNTLRRNRPAIWVEVGLGTGVELNTREQLLSLVPFDCRLLRFQVTLRGFRYVIRTLPHDKEELILGDYLILPGSQEMRGAPSRGSRQKALAHEI